MLRPAADSCRLLLRLLPAPPAAAPARDPAAVAAVTELLL
jgi:hypothetical protein